MTQKARRRLQMFHRIEKRIFKAEAESAATQYKNRNFDSVRLAICNHDSDDSHASEFIAAFRDHDGTRRRSVPQFTRRSSAAAQIELIRAVYEFNGAFKIGGPGAPYVYEQVKRTQRCCLILDNEGLRAAPAEKLGPSTFFAIQTSPILSL